MCLLLEMFTWGKGGCGWSATASLLRVLGSIPSTYMTAYSLLELDFQGIKCPLLTSWDTRLCTRHTDTHASKTPIQVKLKSKLFFEN